MTTNAMATIMKISINTVRQNLSSTTPMHVTSTLGKRITHHLIALLNVLAFAFYITASGSASAQTKITYFHNDLAGSPVAASDSTGTIIWRESYRPYGEKLKNEVAGQSNSQWYTGHRQDAESGLVYMGARHYDPLIGRFLSIDPVGFSEGNPHSFNRYAYANNNPIKFVDPDGREVVSIDPKSNVRLASYINELAKGKFSFDANNKLRMESAEGSGSSHYQSRLVEAINSPERIALLIADKYQGFDVDERAHGGLNAGIRGGNQIVVISGNANPKAIDASGNSFTESPADILVHELVGHAIPKIVGKDTGNAVASSNKVYAQVPGKRIRQAESNHLEWDR
jgi:RHS repeat-associated protein